MIHNMNDCNGTGPVLKINTSTTVSTVYVQFQIIHNVNDCNGTDPVLKINTSTTVSMSSFKWSII